MKPCAHCGSPAEFRVVQTGAASIDRCKYITCTNHICGICTQLAPLNSTEAIQNIIDAWDRRSVLPQAIARVDLVKEELRQKPQLTLVVNK